MTTTAPPPVRAAHSHPPQGGARLRWRQVTATPMSRARAGIWLGLVALTAASWVFVLVRSHDLDTHRAMAPTMGLSTPLFLAVWVAMMIATMFPAVAPMVLMFARIGANKRTAGGSTPSTWLFVTGYLLVWTGLGIVAYVVAVLAENLAAHFTVVSDNAARVGGVLIVVAGAYQFSALKDRCLTECRSPLAFVMQHWRDGRRGAVLMGVHHGWHCAGCCWALMAMMFPLGMMNIAALAGVTTFVYAEKVLPGAAVLRRVAGVALLILGVAVLVHPELLPGTMAHHAGTPVHRTHQM